jgi:WD40 repeat protein
MKPAFPALLLIALILPAFGSSAMGQEKKLDEKKPVKRIWFPRFSPDGAHVLAAHGGWDKKEGGEVRVFSAADGAVQHIFPLPRGVRTVAWSAKGTSFFAGGYGFGIRGFDVKGKKQALELAEDRSVENLRTSSDDKLLVASFGRGDIRLYDLAAKKEIYHFDAVHDGGIWGMALAPDDTLVATAGKDTFVAVHDLTTRKKIHSLKHPGEVNGIAFSPNSRLLATGCSDSRIRIFEVKTGERTAMFQAHERGTVNDLQFTSDGKLLASSGADGTIRVWDVSDLKNPSEKLVLKAHAASAFGVAVSPDDRRVVSVGWDEQVKMWDLKTGQVVWTWKRD